MPLGKQPALVSVQLVCSAQCGQRHL
jgi:hypothetical protein